MMCRVKFCHPSEHPPTSAPPSPPQVEQVRAVYSALRENTHAAQLGFKTSPLVVSGLSAGGNLATAALLYPLLQPRLAASTPLLDDEGEVSPGGHGLGDAGKQQAPSSRSPAGTHTNAARRRARTATPCRSQRWRATPIFGSRGERAADA